MESNYVYFDVTIIGIIQIECTDHDTSDCVTSILNWKTVDHFIYLNSYDSYCIYITTCGHSCTFYEYCITGNKAF